MSIVAVTEKEYAKARLAFDKDASVQAIAVPAAEAELAAAIREIHASHAVVGVLRYSRELYQSLPRGAVLARFGVGHEGIDKAAATAAGIFCTNAPGVLSQSVAEHTMMLMLAAARNSARAIAAAHSGEWSAEEGREIAGKTLAVIGCGAIGSTVARIARNGFGMRVIGCDPVVREAPEFTAIVSDFAGAVRGADFVSLHIPSTPGNARFLNAERLAMLSPQAWVINTARGAVLDELALYQALQTGEVAGAALDVFDREPYEPAAEHCDLRRLANVILTPSIGTNTAEANRRMAEGALRNIHLAEAGRYREMDLLNPELLLTAETPRR